MDRRQFGRATSLGLLSLVMAGGSVLSLLEGCAAVPTATFIQMGLQLLGTVIPTIPGIISAFAALVGKTLSVSQVTKLTSIFQGVGDLFSRANAALQQFQANNDTSLISQIEDLLGQIKTNLAGVLTDVQISDQATLVKITSIVNSFIDLANNLLSILPVVSGGKLIARKVPKARMAQVTASGWATRFNRAVQTSSGNSEIDSAFAGVSAKVPTTYGSH